MPSGARDHLNAALGFLLAAILIVGFAGFVWNIASLQTREALEAERRADQHAANAEQNIESACVGLEPPALAICIREIVKASQEQQRAEYDLAAQRSMARWAGWLLAAAGLSLLITAVGVYFVRDTLIATRASVEVARESMSLQNRAWIKIDLDQEAKLRLLYDTYFIDIEGRIENTGTGVATDIQFYTKLLFVTKDITDIRSPKTEWMIRGVEDATRTQFHRAPEHLLPGEDVPMQADIQQFVGEPPHPNHRLMLVATVSYRLPFEPPGSKAHVTEVVRGIVQPYGPVVFIEGRFDPGDIEEPATVHLSARIRGRSGTVT